MTAPDPAFEAYRQRYVRCQQVHPSPPPEAFALIDDLPLQAQTALMELRHWALELDPVAAMQLLLFDLVDGGEPPALTERGMLVWRAMVHRDRVFRDRVEAAKAARARIYGNAPYSAREGDRAGYTAHWLPEEVRNLLPNLPRADMMGSFHGRALFPTIEVMVDRGIALIREAQNVWRDGFLVTLTDLGRSVWWFVTSAERVWSEAIGDARPTAYAKEQARQDCKAMETAIRLCDRAIRWAEAQAQAA